MDVKKHILVIDRSLLSQNIYRVVLSRFPQLMLHMADTIDAVGSIVADASICNMMLFNANAAGREIELTQEILANTAPYSKLPKLVICSKASMPVWEDWCEDGMAVILEKPFHPDELVSELKRLLSLKL